MMFELPYARSVDTRSFAAMLDYNTQSASYKPLWLSGIVEEVIKGKKEISFKSIGCHMISKVWYPIMHCKLNFGVSDSLPKIVAAIGKKYAIKPDEKVETIYNMIYNIEDKELLDQIKVLYNMVPYRLLSSFYKVNSKESFNKRIMECTEADENSFYTFSKKDKSIVVGKEWIKYINDNQVIISAWVEYSLIFYLQKKNPNIPAIPLKIKQPYRRDLTSATNLWKYFGTQNEMRDIYINKPFDDGNIVMHGGLSIDHFIPWSFVLHDEIWNLIPSFKNINSSKNNALPQLEMYLKEFCEVQYQVFDFIRSDKHQGKYRKEMKKLLEDYVHIMPSDWESEKAWYQVGSDKFKDCLTNTITPLYQIAYNQGYDLWVYKEANTMLYKNYFEEESNLIVAEKIDNVYGSSQLRK